MTEIMHCNGLLEKATTNQGKKKLLPPDRKKVAYLFKNELSTAHSLNFRKEVKSAICSSRFA